MKKRELTITLLAFILVLAIVLCFVVPKLASQTGEPEKTEYSYEEAIQDSKLGVERAEVQRIRILLGLFMDEHGSYPSSLESLAQVYAGYQEPTSVDELQYTATTSGYQLTYRSRVTGKVVVTDQDTM